jgi:probable F420-dependent oxidoreductase
MSVEVGKYGVWQPAVRYSPELAVTLEGLGYETLWIGSADSDLRLPEQLLGATTRLKVATGIVSMWQSEAGELAAAYHRVESRYPGRFLLGLGVGHREAVGGRYVNPREAMEHYLDDLDEAGVPASARALAALRPRMLALSAERTAGAHPYLVTPEHSREARSILGAGPLLAPVQTVVLDLDPARARSIARMAVAHPYLGLTNYINSLRALGYRDDELAGGGSDRLIDALVDHGDAATVAARLAEHLVAGADHVAIQLLTPEGADLVPGYTALAEVLFG